MIIILYHTADRNIKMQLGKYGKRDIDLTLSTVHHDQIRESGKASKLLIHLFFLQFFLFLYSM